MKEVSAYEIAAALAGHPNDPSTELRLLLLFHSEPIDQVEIKPEAVRETLAKAA